MRALVRPFTFALPNSHKIPTIPWYTLLNFRSILLYKNIHPYITYDLIYSSVILICSYFFLLESYAEFRFFLQGEDSASENFSHFGRIKDSTKEKVFFQKIIKRAFFVMKIIF